MRRPTHWLRLRAGPDAGERVADRRGAARAVLTLLVVVAGVLIGRQFAVDTKASASISVSPPAALLDQPTTVSVRGLPAVARATVTATAEDSDGTTWSASAEFQANPAGEISLSQPALTGSYSGLNPMGLFELMRPSEPAKTLFIPPPDGFDVRMQVAVDGRVYATATARRQTAAAIGVSVRELRPARDGIYGTLYLPRNMSARRPAVLVFGGSEGGPPLVDAALLAAHGYPSLALAYFDEPGLPQTLTDIPLEYFTKAITALREQPGVDPRHVLVMGYSRGSEAALLLGVHFPRLVNGVIAGVPSSVVNRATGDRPAWTLRGRPVPAVSPGEQGDAAPVGSPQAVIPVERIRGPILLTCGQLDTIWPSCSYADTIVRRLKGHAFAYPVAALRYPDAGHLAGLMSPLVSFTDDLLTSFGGTVPGTQLALTDGHAKLLGLLAAQ